MEMTVFKFYEKVRAEFEGEEEESEPAEENTPIEEEETSADVTE